jgi:type I restriction enzyme M protein
VIFFRKGESDTANTKAVWVYDLRANMPAFGKTAPIAAEHFAEFEAAYGADPNGGAPRTDRGDEGRFRRFSRDDIAVRGDNLNIGWLRAASGDPEGALTEPEEIAGAIGRHFRAALAEIDMLLAQLGSVGADEPDGVADAAD